MRDALIGQWIKHFRRTARTDDNGLARIGSRSIYILPTKQGLVLAMVLVLMLTGSVNYGSNLGYLLTFLLGGIWLTCILHTWRNLLGLTLSPMHASPVFVGQDAEFKLLLDNPSNLSRYGIYITAKDASGSACDLAIQESKRISVYLTTHHRGQLKLHDVSIHSSYPLGIFHAWTYANPDISCLIYPKPADRGEPPSHATYNRSDTGERGLGADDFVGLRNFRYGDSPRHIDWKVLARERGLYSKLFGGDRTEQISLDWDHITDTDVERRLSLLCRYILLAHERQQSYELRLPGIQIPTGFDEAHKQRCLSCLAKFPFSS